MRRSSRRRGSVSPPTQRLTVFTDTPRCLAAASWERPSRLSTPEIHSAKERWSGRSRRTAGKLLPALAGPRRTSTSTPSGKMRKQTWIWPPSGLAASSRAASTAWWTCWLPSAVRGASAR